MNFYLAQLSGIIAWVFLIMSYWKKNNDKILYLQIIACVFFIVNYIFLGAITGLLVVIFEIIRDLLYIKVEDDKKIFICSIPIYLLISIFSYSSIFSLFSVLASLCDGYALTHKNNKVVFFGIITYLLWIIYDLSCGSYATVFAEILVIISNITILINGYSIFLKSDNLIITKGISFDNALINLFYNIDKNNYNKKVMWSIDKQREVIKSNKTDHILIHDEEEVIGYVNFIRITEEKYNQILELENYVDIDVRDIKKFSKKVGNYVNINSISVKSNYQNEKSIKLIADAIRKYLYIKNEKGFRINGIICVTASIFEEEVFKISKFDKVKSILDKYYVYILEGKKLDKYLDINNM